MATSYSKFFTILAVLLTLAAASQAATTTAYVYGTYTWTAGAGNWFGSTNWNVTKTVIIDSPASTTRTNLTSTTWAFPSATAATMTVNFNGAGGTVNLGGNTVNKLATGSTSTQTLLFQTGD